MGTYYRVTVADTVSNRESLTSGVEATLDNVDRLMSTYRDDSGLSQLNRHENADWFAVSMETARVISTSIEVSKMSDGALDITVGPLVNLWHFGPDRTKEDDVPTEEQIATAKVRVGIDNIEVRIDPPTVRKKRPDIYIDLSSIAKGYAVDRVCEYLRGKGYKNFLVDIGGELKGEGYKTAGKSWRVAIEAPLIDRREIERVVPLENLAMATSGDYRNYFEVDGVRYCHIIDPRTGRPVTHRLASVSVLDPNCVKADAWATALFVLGNEEGFDCAVDHDLTALFIIKEEKGFVERATPAFEKRFPSLKK